MGEYLERHKGMTAGAVAAVIIAAALFAWRSVTAPAGAPLAAQNVFYSADDGASFFVESADKLPPFDWHGKIAHRAAVFTCDGGTQKFVGYLERYPDAARQQLQAARDAVQFGGNDVPPPNTALAVLEVKKPGAGNLWVNRNSRAGAEVLQVICPGGGGGTPELVDP